MNLKRILIVICVVLFSFSVIFGVHAETSDNDKEITILFTHDLHSHLLPFANESGDGVYGGCARIMTAINQQKAKDPNAILVDAGDFSMGTLFQTAYPTSAIELRMLGAMGFDVTTFGNHEFDYFQSGLKSMLKSAINSGDRLPSLVCANYLPPVEGQEGYDPEIWQIYNDFGVKDYVIIERGGIYYVVFGLLGVDADDCAPNSGMVFEDPVTVAKETVAAATEECERLYGEHPIVVCLSHSGTNDGEGEDYELANAVDGIDVIISSHTHTRLDEAIVVNDTAIVSADEYGKNLGVLKLKQNGDKTSILDYKLVPVNEKFEEDSKIAALIQNYKVVVEEDYLSKYGYTFDQVLLQNPYEFESDDEVSASQHESPLCNIYSDAYKWAAEKATGKNVDVAITAAGVIRGSLPRGSVTVSDTFNAASLGVGTEGELIGIYLTGKDIKNAIELDASIQPLMTTAQLFMSGVEYSFNKNRMIFNKVDYAKFRADDGTLSNIENDKLYFVVAGMYMGQMLGSVEETSMGILSITPRDELGNPISTENLVNFVIKDKNGNPLKEWYSIADYLSSMNGEMDSQYATTDGRKIVYKSLNPVKLLKQANIFTYIVLIILVVIITVIVLIIRLICRKRAIEPKK